MFGDGFEQSTILPDGLTRVADAEFLGGTRVAARASARRPSSQCFDVVLCLFGTNVSDLDVTRTGAPTAGDFGGESSSSSSSSGRGSNDRRSASRPATANEATINTSRTRPM
jgi:hypothetical protein